MKYVIGFLVDTGDSVSFVQAALVESETPDPRLESALRANLYQAASGAVESTSMSDVPGGAPPASVSSSVRNGRPARKIKIIDVPEGSTLKSGEVIESSRELSMILGYRYNMVLQAFARAKSVRAKSMVGLSLADQKAAEQIPLTAKLRGVSFCYVN